MPAQPTIRDYIALHREHLALDIADMLDAHTAAQRGDQATADRHAQALRDRITKRRRLYAAATTPPHDTRSTP